jgi:hypothetical protein
MAEPLRAASSATVQGDAARWLAGCTFGLLAGCERLLSIHDSMVGDASFSLADGSMQTIVMNGTPNLTNGGEPIILFQLGADLLDEKPRFGIGTSYVTPSTPGDAPR